MGDFHPTCPKCATAMERGHVPDAAEGMSFPSAWAPGAPRHRRFLNEHQDGPEGGTAPCMPIDAPPAVMSSSMRGRHNVS